MNPLIQDHSGTAPETFRNALSTSQGTNEDDSQTDPHPQTGFFDKQMTQNSDPEEGHDNFPFCDQATNWLDRNSINSEEIIVEQFIPTLFPPFIIPNSTGVSLCQMVTFPVAFLPKKVSDKKGDELTRKYVWKLTANLKEFGLCFPSST